MKNIKIYLIIALVLFVSGLTVTVNLQRKALLKRNAEISRLESNWYASLQFNSTQQSFILKEKELSKKLKAERDSIARLLKIKSKFIEKIIYQTITERDTVIKNVPVYVLGKDRWLVSDTGNCFVWNGIVTLKNDSLKVDRTSYINENKIVETFYRKRNWFLGKRHNFVSKQPKCGTVQTTEFVFLRK